MSLAARLCLLCLATVAYCFSPDLSNVRWRCSGDGQPDDCPQGQVCTAGWCGGSESADGGADGASAAPDLAEPQGCTRGDGVRLAPGVWGCPGPFAKGEGPGLCAPGFESPQSADAVPLGECEKTKGFFLSRVTMYADTFDLCRSIDPKFISCSPKAGYRFRMGCGDWNTDSRHKCEHSCAGFSSAVQCSMSSGRDGFTCGLGAPLSEDVSATPQVGVLCVRKK